MKIDDKAASWNRVKVSLRASLGLQTVAEAAKPPTPEIMKSHEIHEIFRNTYKFMKMHEIDKIS